MTQDEFLEQKVFTGLTIEDQDKTGIYFSEEEFPEVLKQAEYFGISVYDIKTTLEGKEFKTVHHEAFRKKATDANWYNKEFSNLKRLQEGLLYSGTYKVSKKLLDK